MALEGSKTSGKEQDIVWMDEPVLATTTEISEAILGVENIWRRPDSHTNTSIHWRASDYPRLRKEYRIPNVDLIVPDPDERACYPRLGCVTVSEGLRLPIHPFFRFVLRSYGLAPTQLNPNSWSQTVGSWML